MTWWWRQRAADEKRKARAIPGRQRSLWAERTFRAVWAGQTASLFGDQVTGLALPWLILLQTRSAFDAGVISAVRYLPILAFGLAAGVVADRADRRALMIGADLARALALGAVAIIGILGRMPALWLLALVVVVLGLGQLLFQVAYRAWLPELTGDGRLSHATAALEAADSASVLAGYPLAGALIAAIGPVIALGTDALSYLASAATLLGVRKLSTSPLPASAPQSASPATNRSNERGRRCTEAWRDVWSETAQGLRAFVATPVQRLLRVTGAALYAVAGAITVLVVTLTQLRLHLPAWQAGFVFGAMGVGGLLGSALAPRVYAWGWRRGLALALSTAAMGLLALAWACVLAPGPGFAVAMGADALADGSLSLGFVLVGTATTLVTPPQLRGRVNAAVSIYSAVVRALAVVAAGALAANGNPLPAFVALAVCCALAALVAGKSSSAVAG